MTSNKLRTLWLVACLSCACVLAQSCHENRPGGKATPGEEKQAAPNSGQPDDGQSAEDRTLLGVSKVIRSANLTQLSDVCLAYQFDENPSGDAYLVDVRENHRDASCGGDPQTEPHLFTVKVDKHTQAMWTDQGSPGAFRPIK